MIKGAFKRVSKHVVPYTKIWIPETDESSKPKEQTREGYPFNMTEALIGEIKILGKNQMGLDHNLNLLKDAYLQTREETNTAIKRIVTGLVEDPLLTQVALLEERVNKLERILQNARIAIPIEILEDAVKRGMGEK